MVDSIGSYNAAQSLTASSSVSKSSDKGAAQVSASSDVNDTVVISQQAQDIAHILNIVQKASGSLEANHQLTLARNAQALDDLLKA